MSPADAAPRTRCLAVAATGTAAGWGAAAVLVRALAGTAPATADQALVRLCLGALVLAVAWGWVQLLAGVADAWRGAAHRPGAGTACAVRRLALVACGAAVTGGLTALGGVAGADPGVDPGVHPVVRHDRPVDALRGLPLPERAVGPAHVLRADVVVVRAGDTLWRLAERRLQPTASDREVTAAWHRLYAANRSVVGPDPDVLHPGQVLRPAPPVTTTTNEEDR
ncbi:LysM peptidoglycan-binding domain-containing protein [Nocardioides anomalus]|uniref:LysM peptidoglycan-binding domain-containing protein n=1 Tax=Nocardioides anomalus TaxID=2712223 RepID=A0A6G6WFN1_9ACTN|nr:LysM domain-containing protein [Nocardioides anomalus]QIG44016.1 LysM peptidoglycan-binding domain-containing protein [Nocardioides anomalus]